MALNLADRIAVRRNITDRCTAAVTNYALYVLGGGGPQTENYLWWARETLRSPAAVGDAVSWHVLNQPDFIDLGSGISDATLAGAVEAAVNSHFIAPEA